MRSGVTWDGGRYLSAGLLIVSSPLLLIVAWNLLVTGPWNVIAGLGEVSSGRDVVQVADGFDTGVSLLLLILVLLGAGWLVRLRLPFLVAIYGLFLLVPIEVALGIGAEYGVQAVLAGRDYSYCTFHVTSKGRTEEGTYVYVRDWLPGACDAVQATFPPHHFILGRREAFNLPARWCPSRGEAPRGDRIPACRERDRPPPRPALPAAPAPLSSV